MLSRVFPLGEINHFLDRNVNTVWSSYHQLTYPKFRPRVVYCKGAVGVETHHRYQPHVLSCKLETWRFSRTWGVSEPSALPLAAAPETAPVTVAVCSSLYRKRLTV